MTLHLKTVGPMGFNAANGPGVLSASPAGTQYDWLVHQWVLDFLEVTETGWAWFLPGMDQSFYMGGEGPDGMYYVPGDETPPSVGAWTIETLYNNRPVTQERVNAVDTPDKTQFGGEFTSGLYVPPRGLAGVRITRDPAVTVVSTQISATLSLYGDVTKNY